MPDVCVLCEQKFSADPLARGDGAVKRKYFTKAAGFLLKIFIGMLICAVLYLCVYGMALIGIPEAEEVERITISYSEFPDEVRELTEKEDLEMVIQLSDFLNYSLLGEDASDSPPIVTVTYFLKNGDTVTVSANRTSVWWKGKVHALKQEDLFVNLTEGIFF